MKTRFALTLLAASLMLVGCGSDSNYDYDQSVANAQESYDVSNPRAIFDPSTGDIPTTNDLLFNGSEDGTLNIPIDTSADTAAEISLKTALNTLDGFSTTVPVTASFNTAVEGSSIKLGDTVRVFELNPAKTAVATELTAATQLVATASGETLALVPTSPLKPKTTYVVALSNGITSAAGKAFGSSSFYNLTKGTTALTDPSVSALEPVRQLVNGYEALAASQGMNKNDIILSWSFSTQSIDDVMQYVASNATGNTLLTATSGMTTKALLDPTNANPAVKGNADVLVGTLTVPYYSPIAANTSDTSPLSGYWKGAADSNLTRYNPAPATTGDVTIPVLITVPNANAVSAGTAPAGGWPVVIFQHGITGNRTNMLGIAETLADAGFVTVAIDMALHGVSPTSPLHASVAGSLPGDQEQTFDLDLVNNTTGASGPDGITDASGTHFINLTSMLSSRDAVRQSVSNLLVLRKSLGNMVAAAGTAPSINADEVNFVGHSLGAMVGTLYLALDNSVGAGSLAMPGGGIAQLLNNSATFGPRIKAGLAANGVSEGTEAFESFFAAAQWMIDSADPLNYGAAATANHPVHMMEVVGGNSGAADQVIPNSVAGAPLSGTEPLAAVMGLDSVSSTTTDANGIDGIVRFVAGNHSSILDPTEALDVTVEMQTEVATFLVTGGTVLPVNDTSVVQ